MNEEWYELLNTTLTHPLLANDTKSFKNASEKSPSLVPIRISGPPRALLKRYIKSSAWLVPTFKKKHGKNVPWVDFEQHQHQTFPFFCSKSKLYQWGLTLVVKNIWIHWLLISSKLDSFYNSIRKESIRKNIREWLPIFYWNTSATHVKCSNGIRYPPLLLDGDQSIVVEDERSNLRPIPFIFLN